MGTSVVAGDIGGPYTETSTGIQQSFPMVSGSLFVLHAGLSQMLVGQALTAGGPIIAGAPFTVTTLIEGRLAYVGGAVTLLPNWVGGVLTSANALFVIIN